jgi:hypothetical protein
MFAFNLFGKNIGALLDLTETWCTTWFSVLPSSTVTLLSKLNITVRKETWLAMGDELNAY